MQIYERIMDVMRNIQKEEIVAEQSVSARRNWIRRTESGDSAVGWTIREARNAEVPEQNGVSAKSRELQAVSAIL